CADAPRCATTCVTGGALGSAWREPPCAARRLQAPWPPATTWQQTRVLTSALLSWQLIVRQRLRRGFRTVRMCRSHRVCVLGAATQAWSARYPARVAGVVLCHRLDAIIVCQGSD